MYSGYTAMSNLSGEIRDKTLIPKGLLIILPLTALSYILPTIGGLASVGQWKNWTTTSGEGISFGNVLAQIGDWGLPLFLIVAIMANLSIFNTYITSISRGFFAMAEDNLAPKSLVKTNKKHVPYVGVVSLGAFCLLACTFDFSIIVTVDVMLLMVDYVLVWISGIALRKNEPDMPRPFKIPGGTGIFVAVVAPGLVIAILALMLNGADYYFAGMIGFVSSPIMYYIWKRMYGGLYKSDPNKYPINTKTKLACGDLHRMVMVFGFLAIMGIFCSFIFFPWYEADWREYYVQEYGMNAQTIIMSGIKLVSFIYAVIAVILKIIALKPAKKSQEKI